MPRKTTLPLFLALLALPAGVGLRPGAAMAQAPAPAQAQAPAAAVDPRFAAAQKVFDALPEADRKAIQENLIWTGDFSGAGTGGFGPLTYKAILAFQARQKARPDGILQPSDRAALDAQATLARTTVKFTRLVDARTGIRIGVPQKPLDKVRAGATGTVFFGVESAAALETIAGKDDLAQLYGAMTAEAPNRKVTYKVLRPDWFVVAADAAGRRTYVRVNAVKDGLRGYSFSYPVARAAEFDRLSIAIANSFDAAPSAPPPAVAGPTPPQPGPQVLPPGPARPPALLLTGLVVAPGKVVTAATIEGCPAPLVGRQPATVSRVDKAAGYALLDAPAARAASAAPLAHAPLDGADLVVVGFTPAGPDLQLTAAGGEARLPAAGGLRIFAPLQRGAPGSPVFDRTGALVGIVAPASSEPRQVAGILPQASWPLVPASAFAPASAGPAATAVITTGAIASAARPWVVAVECGR